MLPREFKRTVPEPKRTIPELVEGRVRTIMIVALMIIFTTAPSANAEDDQLGISADGRSWATALDTALFDPAVRWVPGDSRSASVWVRNQSTEDARLTVDLVDVRGRSLLESGNMKLLIMVDDHVVQPVEGRLVEVPVTSPSERTKITITVSFDAGAGNATQGRSLSFNLIATLTQAPGEQSSPSEESPTIPHGIADTGAPVALGLMAIIALTLLIIGSVILRRGSARARRRDGAPHSSQVHSSQFHSKRERGSQP